MGLSDFRKKKLLYVFNVFFDVNHSGTIEKKDFEIAIEKISHMRGCAAGTQQYDETKNTLLKIWDGLRQRADFDHDGEVTQDEWCKMWDDFAKNPDSAKEWQNLYMNFMFDLEDSSGDGFIDEGEFTTVCTMFGLSPEECKLAFNKFTSNNTVMITREVFADLWKQYFSSEDVTAAGNFIFGKSSFD